MATTISIRCNDDLAEQINQRTKPHESLSVTGKVTLERGFAVLQAESRALSKYFSVAEWKVILSSYDGTMTNADILRDDLVSAITRERHWWKQFRISRQSGNGRFWILRSVFGLLSKEEKPSVRMRRDLRSLG